MHPSFKVLFLYSAVALALTQSVPCKEPQAFSIKVVTSSDDQLLG